MPAIRTRNSSQDDGPNVRSLACKPLIEVADRNLFQQNAFRITGLSSRASSREITKHGDKLKIQEELGGAAPSSSGAFTRQPAATLDEIRDALQRLRTPDRRLIDEFFWFWPTTSENGHPDAALEVLRQGEADAAISIWRTQENEEPNSVVAQHNLAVAYYIAALDRENAAVGRGTTEEKRTKIAGFWRSSIKRWIQIAEDDHFWGIVRARIRELNEPNLAEGFSSQLRANLLVALCKVHTEFVVAYLESAQTAYAQSQVSLIKQISRDTGSDRIAAEIVLKPTAIRLRQQVALAEEKAVLNPGGAADVATELLRLARSVIAHFDLLLSTDDPTRTDLFDDIADAANRIQLCYHKATSDDQTCLDIVQSALPYAHSQETRQRLENNLATLRSNLSFAQLAPAYAVLKEIQDSSENPYEKLGLFRRKASPMLTFVTTGMADTDAARKELLDAAAILLRGISVEAWNSSNNLLTAEAAIELGLQLAQSLETHSRLLEDQKHLAGIRAEQLAFAAAKKQAEEKAKRRQLVGWAIGAGVLILLIIAGNSGNNNSRSGSSGTSGNGTYRIPSYASAELARDRQAIESTKASVAQRQNQVESMGSQIDRERAAIDSTSQAAIDSFNRSVENYNALLADARAQNARLNLMIDAYNAKLQRYGK